MSVDISSSHQNHVAELEELERLRQENRNLSSQVNRLTWAERRMIESQDRLDRQIQYYQQLNQIGQKYHACLSRPQADREIFRLATEFIIYELNFERALVLAYDAATQRYCPHQWDGYYDETSTQQVEQLALTAATAAVQQLQTTEYLLVSASSAEPDLLDLGQQIGLDEYLLFGLQFGSGQPQFLVALGNSMAKVKYYARVQPDSELIVVLSNLISQVGSAINQSHLYAQIHTRAEELQATLQDLQQAQTQLVQHEKMSALGNLVAGVAHEINNPLGFLLGNLQPAETYVTDLFQILDLYQQHYPNPAASLQTAIQDIDLAYLREDLPKLLGSMRLGIDRIRSISTSLRTFSRADQSHKVPFDIHEGIDSTLLILQHRLKSTQQRPAIVVSRRYGELPEVNCFPGQLNQVFMNLLANAIDALEESNAERSFESLEKSPNQIEIETYLVQNWVMICVRDNGMGMTEAIRARIFDHLFTTKAVGKGTGLGLAIAHQIVTETHGGKITCLSQPGQGTEFQIQLPWG
jgi:signal transduction histidine kinase